jgi:hypothetical protein
MPPRPRVDRRKRIRIGNGATTERESLQKRTQIRAKRVATTRYHRTSPEDDEEPAHGSEEPAARLWGGKRTGRRVAALLPGMDGASPLESLETSGAVGAREGTAARNAVPSPLDSRAAGGVGPSDRHYTDGCAWALRGHRGFNGGVACFLRQRVVRIG